MTKEAQARLEPERTVDAFLGGRVALVQPRSGHRAGLDAALLQALIPAGAAGRAIDLGAGVGTVAFCLAARAPNLSVIGIERDPGLLACGREALALPENSGFAARIRFIEADVTRVEAVLTSVAEAGSDFVLMNPPFAAKDRGSQSPDPSRRDAHVAAEGLLRSWCTRAAALLKAGGMLGLIHRADALSEVLEAIAQKFGGVQVLPVHPSETASAIRVLVTARRGSRAPLALLPGLILHRPDGGWTPRADAILRGQADLGAFLAH